MKPKITNLLLAATWIGASLPTMVLAQSSEPQSMGICMRNVIAAYNDSKTASLVCMDQLEADINEGLATGLPLSPIEIEARTQTCQNLEMTKEERKAAQDACRAAR